MTIAVTTPPPRAVTILLRHVHPVPVDTRILIVCQNFVPHVHHRHCKKAVIITM